MQHKFLLFLTTFLSGIPFFYAQQPNLEALTFSELDSFMYLSYNQRDYKTALLYTEQAMKKAKTERGEMDSVYAEYLDNTAYFYKELAQYPKAEAMFLESLKIREKLFGKIHLSCAATLANLATVHQYMGGFDQSETYNLEAREIRKTLLGEQHPIYAESLNNLGHLYENMGRYEEAEPLYLQTKDIWETAYGKNSVRYGMVLNSLAVLYYYLKKYAKSETYYKESIETKKGTLGIQHPSYAISLGNLAALYYELNDYKKAEPLYLESTKLFKSIFGELNPSYITSMNNLSNLYRDIGEYPKAMSYYEQTLHLHEQIKGKFHPLYASTLNSLGKNFYLMQKFDTAFAFCMAGIAANAENFETVFPDFFTASIEHSIGFNVPNFCCPALKAEALLKLSNLSFRSKTIVKESLMGLLDITWAQYQLLLQSNKTTQANDKLLQHYNISKAAMNLNEQIRNDFSGKIDKLRVVSNNGLFAKFGIDAALKLEQQQYIKEAFSFAEQNKSVLLTDALKGSRAHELGDLPDSLAVLENELQEKKELLKLQKIEAKSTSEKELISIKENELNLQINDFLKSLQNKYPKYHQLKYENITAQATDLQKILGKKTALMEYFITDSTTYLFAVLENEVLLYPLAISKTELTEKIKGLRQALCEYQFILKKQDESYSIYIQYAHWFYKNLLRSALEDRAIENLIIIADGELAHLPFEAFLVENVDQKERGYATLHYLINDYNISYDYSATLWKQNFESPAKTNNRQMLALAAAYKTEDSSLVYLRGVNHFKLRQSLQPLPAAQGEVEALSKFFAGVFLQGEHSNELFFKSHAQEYGIIHLAMHGILNSYEPILSSLALTENRDSLNDNFLQAFEISNLSLNADLVVLSACETGYGKFEQGEGVMSLARSFMYAGVPSLVVSLWQVNDHSTSVIMQFFYQYLAEGMAKDAALRQAKLDYLKQADGIAAHPAFWSPFIQLGDSSAIEIKTQSNWILWLVGSISFLILGLVILKMRKKAL